jgi:hypothetical protein
LWEFGVSLELRFRFLEALKAFQDAEEQEAEECGGMGEQIR